MPAVPVEPEAGVEIDDLRESPAVTVVRELAAARVGEILAVEPHTDALPPELAGLDGVAKAGLDEALERAAIVVLLADHKEFREVPKARLTGKLVFDTRGTWR